MSRKHPKITPKCNRCGKPVNEKSDAMFFDEGISDPEYYCSACWAIVGRGLCEGGPCDTSQQ